MKVIYKEPGKRPEIIHVDNTLEALQNKVGGYIEVVQITADTCIICNEEGRILGMEHNCVFMGKDFCGPIMIVGTKGDSFTSLHCDCASFLLAQLTMARG